MLPDSLASRDYPPQRPRRVALSFANSGTPLLAGPYRSNIFLQGDHFLVKMAQEVNAVADVSVPCADFGVPNERVFRHALMLAAKNLLKGRAVFVGCAYGIGRTGVFLAALHKLHREVLWRSGLAQQLGDDAVADPVAEVRASYYKAAVETLDQANFVRALDLRWLSRWIALRIRPASIFDNRFWAT